MKLEWSRKEEQVELNVRTRLWIAGALALAILPHLGRLPVWVPVFFLVVAAMQISAWRATQRTLPRWMITALVIVSAVGVLAEYGTLVGQYSGLALLTSMISLKMLDMRTKRDVMVVVYMTYFLTVANFIFTQTIEVAVYMFAVVLVTTATLIEASYPSIRRTAMDNFRLSGSLIWQALPLMLVMFLFFPRLPARIWALPDSEQMGVTGLSDSMNLGTLLQVAQSEKVAFRVTFEDTIPPPEERYWRGPVFWYTDGRTWSGGKERHQRMINRRPSRERYPVNHSGRAYRQTVTLEPHRERWLFALDVPVEIEGRSYVATDVQWMSYRNVEERLRYDAVSLTGAEIQSPSVKELRRCLQLPEWISSRVTQLAEQWVDESESPEEVIERAIRFYAEGDYAYSLSPPLMPPDYVESFLFDTKIGFCEHFAASFAILMRAAGIPTRVVTGYMGGELNPVGDYLIVRQSDAHAWCEVWYEGRGWVRIDPTGVANPRRISGRSGGGGAAGDASFFWTLIDGRIFRPIKHGLDALNNAWNQWVLGYDIDVQRDFMARVGMPDANWKKLTAGLLTISAAVVGLLALWILFRTVRAEDPVLAAYQRFTDKIARLGIYHQPYEGPVDFRDRVCAAHPELRHPVSEIIAEYVGLRYGAPSTARDPDRLTRLVRLFRPVREPASM